MVSAAVLLIVVGAAINYIAITIQRSKTEQVKVDMTQEGREFVDEFERDVHQIGFPGCADFDSGGATHCSANTANYGNANIAVGIVSISSTNLVFEGDVNGDGLVESVQYQLVDSAGNYPPSTTCPCTLQRSQITKVATVGLPAVLATYSGVEVPKFSQELQNVVNSGAPTGGALYGNGLNIAGNVLGTSTTNTAYYAAVTTFKDFPVISAYDQTGAPIQLPLDNSTSTGQQNLANIKSIRLTINLLGSATTGNDLKTRVRPVVTLVGDARRNNMMPSEVQ